MISDLKKIFKRKIAFRVNKKRKSMILIDEIYIYFNSKQQLNVCFVVQLSILFMNKITLR